MAQWYKNPTASVGDTRDRSLIPGSARSPGGGNDHHSSIALEIPWTEEPAGLVSGVAKNQTQPSIHTCTLGYHHQEMGRLEIK